MPQRLFLLCVLGAISSQAFACPYADEIEREAQAVGLPGRVMVLIAQAESSCRADVVGDHGASRGLFQFTKATWQRYSTQSFDRAFNPHENIQTTIKYLRACRCGSDPRNYAAWINAGVRDWRKLNTRWSIHHPNRVYRKLYQGNF